MTKKILLSNNVTRAWKLARSVRKLAYAPYSKFLVGSALKFKNDKNIFVGCNFENASYGATICAERNALGAAIAKGVMSKKKRGALEFVVVVTDTTNATPPCGLCLQAMNEFADSETIVYLATPKGIVEKAKFSEFLPTPFKTIEIL